MSVAHFENSSQCRFRGEHPTTVRPASRVPLMRGRRERAGATCAATQRGLRTISRPGARDTRYRRPAARSVPPRRTS